MSTESETEQGSFDADEWKRDSPVAGQRGARSSMVESLIESKILIGLTRNKVRDLLGTPYPDKTEAESDTTDVFLVGADRQFGIDNEWVVVEYTDDNRVSSAILKNE